MDFTPLIGPAVVAAFVSGVISVVGMFVNRSTTIRMHSEKLDADGLLAERKVAADIELAKQKFEYDRMQAIFRRRFDLAEQLISDAYQFSSLMTYVRSGISFGAEGETRNPEPYESEGLKRTRDGYFVPIERLKREDQFLAGMFARRTAGRAHFGSDVDEAFRLFNEAAHRVRTSSSLLVSWTSEIDRPKRDLEDQFRRDIWQPMAEYSGHDEVGLKISEGVKLLEAICSPVLAWSATAEGRTAT